MRSRSDTLLLSYSAKKRAEAAPGVGKETDVIVIGPRLGEMVKIEEAHLSKLDALYQESRTKHERIQKQTQEKAKKLVEEVREEYRKREEEEKAKGSTEKKK